MSFQDMRTRQNSGRIHHDQEMRSSPPQTPSKKPRHDSNIHHARRRGESKASYQQTPSYSPHPIQNAAQVYDDMEVDDECDNYRHPRYNLSSHRNLRTVSSSSSESRLRVKPRDNDNERLRRPLDSSSAHHHNSGGRKVDKLNGNFDRQGGQGPQHDQNSNGHQHQCAVLEHNTDFTLTNETTPPRRAPKRTNCLTPPGKKSTFSLVSDDIVRFQKMVLDLNDVLETSTTNPADQWRSKILMGSAEELASTIQHQLINHLEEIERMDSRHAAAATTRAKAAHMKLKRDFRRMHTKFHDMLTSFRKRQLQDVANLYGGDAAIDESNLLSYEQRQLGLIRQREDDYNIQIMREREAEIADINKKMHTVNEIYKELSLVVNNQQETIEGVEDSLNMSRANVECGLEHLEQARVKANSFYFGKDSGGEGSGDPNISWSTPFETLQEDLEDVRKDLLSFGSDIMGVSMTKLKLAKSLMFGNCVPDNFSYKQQPSG